MTEKILKELVCKPNNVKEAETLVVTKANIKIGNTANICHRDE